MQSRSCLRSKSILLTSSGTDSRLCAAIFFMRLGQLSEVGQVTLVYSIELISTLAQLRSLIEFGYGV